MNTRSCVGYLIAGLTGMGVALLAGAAQQPEKAKPDPEARAAEAWKQAPEVKAAGEFDAAYDNVMAQEAKQIGRYQIQIHPIAARNTFLVDTATGRTWILVQNQDKSSLSWELMNRTP